MLATDLNSKLDRSGGSFTVTLALEKLITRITEHFAKVFNGFLPLSIFAKKLHRRCLADFEYTFEHTG